MSRRRLRSLRRRRARLAIVAGALAVALVGGASPAAAHYVYDKLFTYRSSENCVENRSEASHGSGGGYARTDVWSWNELSLFLIGTQSCGWFYTRPSGYIRTAFDWYVYTSSGWALCAYTPWYYNTSSTDHMAISYDFGSSPWCGSGYYGTYGLGYVYHGSQWYGGGLWSGHHLLPA